MSDDSFQGEMTGTRYTILKGRFKAIDTNTFGLFLLFINEDLEQAENVAAIASHFSSIYETDPKTAWNEIEERIFNLKWKGEFATSITRDLQSYLESVTQGAHGDELYTLIKDNYVSKIESYLSTLLSKPLTDRNIHLEISWERVTPQEIMEAKAAREAQEFSESGPGDATEESQLEAENHGFNIEQGAVLLDVALILAPVSGIPIYEVKAGDSIMVKIDPTSNRGRYFIELLNAMHENEVVPVPALVQEVRMNKMNEYTILVKIGEGIYGQTIETEQVKLKRYNPAQDKRGNQLQGMSVTAPGTKRTETKQDKAISNLYWLMYLGGFVVVVILLLIIAAAV